MNKMQALDVWMRWMDEINGWDIWMSWINETNEWKKIIKIDEEDQLMLWMIDMNECYE